MGLGKSHLSADRGCEEEMSAFRKSKKADGMDIKTPHYHLEKDNANQIDLPQDTPVRIE
jgi:hypothetical protein